VTITVLYSCPECGLSRVPCDVPARGDEDVLVWMKQTLAVVSRDHDRRSPHCRPRQLVDLHVPMTSVDRIGGATRH